MNTQSSEVSSSSEVLARPCIVGRSSSHFTRVVRIFAAEAGVSCGFRVVPDLTSSDVQSYGGNPGLRLPNLQTGEGTWFGSLNSCLELSRLSTGELRMVWPHDRLPLLAANATELAVQAMSTEVTMIMCTITGGNLATYVAKLKNGLLGMMTWLESHVDDALAALPAQRDLSYFELSLFCLIEHLEFRDVLPTTPYRNLNRFRQGFAARPSAQATVFAFDK